MGTLIPFLNAVKSSVSIVFLTLIISLTTTVHHGIAENVYSNVHKDMNLDEIRSIFHVDSHLEVPEYEVIHIKPNRPSHNDEDSSTASSTEYDYINQQNFETTTTLIDEADYMLIDEEPTGNKINNDQHSTDNSIVVDNKSESKLVKDGDKNKKFSKKYPKKTTPGLSKYKKSDNINKYKSDKVFYTKSNVNVLSSNEQADKDRLETVIPLNNGVRILEENIQLEAFGQKFNLTLKPTDGLIKKGGLKIFTVEPNVTSQHGVDYVEIQQDENEESVGDIYQDEHNEAAILLRPDKESGGYLMEGSIGKDLVIKPLPKHLRKLKPDLSDDEMFLNQDDLNSEVSIDTGLPIRRRPKRNIQNNLVEHVIYKRKLNEEDYLSDYMLMEPDHISKRYRRSTTDHKRSKREAPYVIYPEILVIVDYDGYRLHGGDNLQIKRYFVSFWNGVDLRYKLLKGPKVRISIAGIIISRGRDATPYLERNRVGRDAIDSAAALTDMGKYLFKERRLPVYDIAVAITKYDMCRRRKGGRCTKGTAGFAYVGGACVVNKRLEKVNSVAIIEDTGGFSGIIVAAHEVGHLLGAVHDGSPPPSYLGGPGAEKCRWEDGYIMSDLRHTERGFRWSPCSIQSFHHFLNGDTATCLYNSPHEDESLGRVLPGKLLSLDAQCRRDRGTSACFKDDRVCAQLFCFDSGSGYCVAYRPAAEGSSCGDGQYCINGRCVTEHENIIPDYSQNTPSYIRRQDVNVDDLLGYQNTAATELRPLYYNSTTQRYYSTTTTEAPTTSTTQNYYNYYQQQTESTENPYYNSYYSSTNNDYTTSKYNYYNNYKSTIPTTTTTQKPYYYYSTTTKAPAYNWQYYKTSSSSTKTSRTTTTTTKKPYTYSYTTTTTLPSTINSYTTTKNPYVGDYYERLRSTTKNPYDFANFGRSTTASSTDDVSGGNNNYLKRSSNYYSASQQSNSYSQINNNATTRRPFISGR